MTQLAYAWTIDRQAGYFAASFARKRARGMQLASMRYTKIDGTAVAVTVTSSAEAKAALKELRHKQRELKFLRAALRRRLQMARPPAAAKRKLAVSLLGRIGRSLWWLAAKLFELATVPKTERRARDPAEMEKELQRIDETLHNIEGCTLQVQGKLLARG